VCACVRVCMRACVRAASVRVNKYFILRTYDTPNQINAENWFLKCVTHIDIRIRSESINTTHAISLPSQIYLITLHNHIIHNHSFHKKFYDDIILISNLILKKFVECLYC
jgi:hypothetical protein